MSNNADKKIITLKSSDGEELAKMSQTISNLIENNCTGVSISLSSITGTALAKAIEYCEKYVFEQEGEVWDREFVNVDLTMIFDLIQAADFMAIQGLLDLTCKKVADQMTNKSLEEIRKILNIEND